MISDAIKIFTKVNIVTNCKTLIQNPKVFQKNADIQNVGNTKSGVIDMYAMWPGCYSFRDEIKMFALWLKEQLDSLMLKIYEIDRAMNG